jgi:hypothetical protein
MAWYDDKTCALCARTIGKKWFWQDKPRLVARDGTVRDCAYVDAADVAGLLQTHVLVCHSCYLNRFGEVKALVDASPRSAS